MNDYQKAARKIENAWTKSGRYKANNWSMGQLARRGLNAKWVKKSRDVNWNWNYLKVPHSMRKGYTQYHKTKWGKFHKLPYITRNRKYI